MPRTGFYVWLKCLNENFGMFQKHYFIQFEGLIKLVHLSFSISYDFDRENVQMTEER